MNYSLIDEAYNISHVNQNTYSGLIVYDSMCIYCSCKESSALLPDGSFRVCKNCRKEFKSRILTKPILNYNNSIKHLMPRTEYQDDSNNKLYKNT